MVELSQRHPSKLADPEKLADTSSSLDDKYEEILKKSSGKTFGRYQSVSTLVFVCAIIGWDYIELALGYYLMMPSYLCRINNQMVECSRE